MTAKSPSNSRKKGSMTKKTVELLRRMKASEFLTFMADLPDWAIDCWNDQLQRRWKKSGVIVTFGMDVLADSMSDDLTRAASEAEWIENRKCAIRRFHHGMLVALAVLIAGAFLSCVLFGLLRSPPESYLLMVKFTSFSGIALALGITILFVVENALDDCVYFSEEAWRFIENGRIVAAYPKIWGAKDPHKARSEAYAQLYKVDSQDKLDKLFDALADKGLGLVDHHKTHFTRIGVFV